MYCNFRWNVSCLDFAIILRALKFLRNAFVRNCFAYKQNQRWNKMKHNCFVFNKCWGEKVAVNRKWMSVFYLVQNNPPAHPCFLNLNVRSKWDSKNKWWNGMQRVCDKALTIARRRSHAETFLTLIRLSKTASTLMHGFLKLYTAFVYFKWWIWTLFLRITYKQPHFYLLFVS